MYQESVIEAELGRIWFRVLGNLNHRTRRPLLVLHGGPGMPHDYLSNLADFTDDGRAVIFYDQLGCGRSGRSDNPFSQTLEYFVSEIDIVRRHLSVDSLHIIGHSWGGWLATEYALRASTGIRSLVLANTPPSVPAYRRQVRELVDKMPWRYRRVLRSHTRGNKFDKAYRAFLDRHLCSLDPWPPELTTAWANAGEAVYRTLWGENELDCTGTLRDWDSTERLGDLHMPVLLAAGRHDEVRPSQVAAATQIIPDNRFVIFENSAHFPHLEEPERFKAILSSWLTEHDDA